MLILLVDHYVWIVLEAILMSLESAIELWRQRCNWEQRCIVLDWVEVVVLGFDNVVLAPLGEPFSLLIFNNHLLLL